VQIYYDSTFSADSHIPIWASGTFTINNCIYESRRSSSFDFDLRDSSAVMANCLLLQRGSSFSGQMVQNIGRIRNCTVCRPSDLTAGGTGVGPDNFPQYPHVKNTTVFGFSTMFGGTIGDYGGESSHNASSVAASSIPGGNDQENLTYSSQFQNTSDSTRDFRAVASGSLDENGTRDETYTGDLDIIGQARSTTTPTIGCWEVVVGGGVVAGLRTLAQTGVGI
jgi:hypothetical protein